MTAEAEVTRSVLMYFVLPLWLLAGFADYLCHRASRIATTSGPKESLIHLMMLGEIGIAVTVAMSFEINAAIILLMIIVWATHEATALWEFSSLTTNVRLRRLSNGCTASYFPAQK
jgi:Ca2+/Na+ antiporter